MVVDTSALVAILMGEPEAPEIESALAEHRPRLLSTASFVEASIVIEAKLGDAGVRELDLLLHRAKFELVDVDTAQAELARWAYRCFGKGRHPAGLNFGDCFAYALARSRGEALLYKGQDFAKTDVESILEPSPP